MQTVAAACRNVAPAISVTTRPARVRGHCARQQAIIPLKSHRKNGLAPGRAIVRRGGGAGARHRSGVLVLASAENDSDVLSGGRCGASGPLRAAATDDAPVAGLLDPEFQQKLDDRLRDLRTKAATEGEGVDMDPDIVFLLALVVGSGTGLAVVGFEELTELIREFMLGPYLDLLGADEAAQMAMWSDVAHNPSAIGSTW